MRLHQMMASSACSPTLQLSCNSPQVTGYSHFLVFDFRYNAMYDARKQYHCLWLLCVIKMAKHKNTCALSNFQLLKTATFHSGLPFCLWVCPPPPPNPLHACSYLKTVLTCCQCLWPALGLSTAPVLVTAAATTSTNRFQYKFVRNIFSYSSYNPALAVVLLRWSQTQMTFGSKRFEPCMFLCCWPDGSSGHAEHVHIGCQIITSCVLLGQGAFLQQYGGAVLQSLQAMIGEHLISQQ